MEASLVTRLAGPSTGKAGLSKDQTEINRVIAEASKGSKFFENEKRKDQDLTEKIKRLLKFRDEMMRGIDLALMEDSIDKTLMNLESTRDLTQTIVHLDMDAFFASVELLDNPTFKGKPFGVGKGVLTTASYDARIYGVRSGMPGFIAKKLCPHIILVPIRGNRYSEMSRKVMDVFRRYDPDMLAAGTDEAFLNITRYCQTHQVSPNDCVQRLRAEVLAETELTVSAGIAPNKMLAKICSDKNKPNGQFHLPFDRDEIIAFMRDLSIRKIPGIGRVTERLLDSVGVKTCGDIYKHRATLALLDKQFHLNSLLCTHLGIASNVVEAYSREERKSIGSERTFNPISDEAQIIKKLEYCATELEEDMERGSWAGRTVTLKYKLDTYEVFTRAKSTAQYITRKEELLAIGKKLLMPEFPLTIRLIGLRVTKLKDLQVQEEQGIEKFFELAKSPNKKRQKLDHKEEEFLEFEASQHALEEEQAMAEYEDDLDGQMDIEGKNAIEESGDITESRPKLHSRHSEPPQLTPPERQVGSTNSTTKNRSPPRADKNVSRKPKSEIKPKAEKTHVIAANPKERQTCPICSRGFETDNARLNEHIDFCLSRGAILAATAVQQAPPKVGTKRKLGTG